MMTQKIPAHSVMYQKGKKPHKRGWTEYKAKKLKQESREPG